METIKNGTISKTPMDKAEMPIEHFFRANPEYDPHEDRLLDLRNSHRWFKNLRSCIEADTYIFQKAVEYKSGPEAIIDGRPYQVFSSYDYLGLIGHPAIEQAAINSIKKYGTGSGGVRLLTGTNRIHEQLEDKIRQFKGTEEAMTFSSGYLANIAAIAGLAGPGDLVVADEYIHRSLIDAMKVCSVPCKTFMHNNVDALKDVLDQTDRSKRVFILVEGIYSMDGDICKLPEIVEIKKQYDAFLVVDEAHSLGVLGRSGRGVDEHFGVDPSEIDIFTGSLSKSIPCNGGFIAARQEVVHYLKHGGAPYMFSAALSPAIAGAALAALEVMEQEPWRLRSLWENSRHLLAQLQNLPLNTGKSESPIIPIITGSNESAFHLSRYLYDKGYLATSVIYPAVPGSMARLRLCMTAVHRKEVIDHFVADLDAYCKL